MPVKRGSKGPAHFQKIHHSLSFLVRRCCSADASAQQMALLMACPPPNHNWSVPPTITHVLFSAPSSVVATISIRQVLIGIFIFYSRPVAKQYSSRPNMRRPAPFCAPMIDTHATRETLLYLRPAAEGAFTNKTPAWFPGRCPSAFTYVNLTDSVPTLIIYIYICMHLTNHNNGVVIALS